MQVFTPTVTTQLSATTIIVGQSVTDTATLTGTPPDGDLDGTVTYNFYSGGSCSSFISSNSQTVIGGFVPTSTPFTPMSAGTFSFKAHYGGSSDGDTNVADSICEILTVNKASPTLSTVLSATTIGAFDGADADDTLTDSAFLAGATATAGGTVTYYVFTGGACSGGPIDFNTQTVTNAIVPTSVDFGFAGDFSPASTYSLNTVYTGDLNNNGFTSTCEVLTAT